MRKAGVGIAVASFLFSSAMAVFAQEKEPVHHTGKAGLWEVTTTMTWQKSPARLGPPNAPPAAGSHTTSVCLTQDMVDAGALLPQSRGQCHIQNKVVKPGRVTANYLCTGKMKGMGALVSDIPDLEHVTGSIHFIGSLESDGRSQPIEWTTTSSAVYKGEQCSKQSTPAPQTPPAAK